MTNEFPPVNFGPIREDSKDSTLHPLKTEIARGIGGAVRFQDKFKPIPTQQREQMYVRVSY